MIHRDTEELAENKLLLLYILSEAGIPLSKNQVTQVVLENSLMNYFSMQQFLAELVQKDWWYAMKTWAGIFTGYNAMGTKCWDFF